MASLLIESGADVTLLTTEGRTVLHFAAEFGNIETHEMLTRSRLCGVDPTMKSADGLTASQVAARRRVAAETSGLELSEEWSQAFEELLKAVKMDGMENDEIGELAEHGEKLFLDAMNHLPDRSFSK